MIGTDVLTAGIAPGGFNWRATRERLSAKKQAGGFPVQIP